MTNLWKVELVIGETADETLARAQTLTDSTLELMKSKKYSEAFNNLNQARGIYRQLGRKNEEGFVRVQISFLSLLSRNDSNAYVQNLEQAKELFKETNNLVGLSISHYQLGLHFCFNEKILECRNEFDSVEAILKLGEDRILKSDSIFNISSKGISFMRSFTEMVNAGTYYQMGDYKSAENMVKKIVLSTNENRFATPYAYFMMGGIYKKYYKDSLISRNYYEKSLASLQAGDFFEFSDSSDEQAKSMMQKLLLSTLLPEIQKELGMPISASSQEKSANSESDFLLSSSMFKAGILNSIGDSYFNEGNYSAALENYEKALVNTRLVSSKGLERTILGSIGDVLRIQNKTEVAITFYKQSINLIEEVRGGLKTLPKEQQRKYVESVENNYRNLVNLLLSKSRVLEAQVVLDLLKGEELFNYIQDSRSTFNGEKLIYTSTEQEIISRYKSLVEFGKEVSSCKKDCTNLNDMASRIRAEYDNYIKSIENQSVSQTDIKKEAEGLIGNARAIVEKPGTVLIQTLSYKARNAGNIEDELWILWTSKGIVNRIKVSVTEEELSRTVREFRELLLKRENSNSQDLQSLHTVGKKIYDWIVKPVELAVQDKQGINHIVFSLDRSLRYVPMSALYDGEQYLVQKYNVSNIIRASETDVTRERRIIADKNNVAAFGVSERYLQYSSLPHVEEEVKDISSEPLLNSRFTMSALRDKISSNSILHLATHGKFTPQKSSLLLGGGDPREVTNENISSQLPDRNLNLVVLSACETAVGDIGNGIEVSALNYSFMRNGGAKSVLASLWQVNDGSTSDFMRKFYTNLRTGENSRVEALRKVQLDFLQSQEFSHPYYWSGFTLTGNSN
ncbi:MAG: CHAT domain-containing protein [Cyanobacteria bacterium]|nr:CHAT domain-containing protein [Cyanobacteriota bacterium]